METDKLKKDYLPMSETAYYILLSLLEVRHGYGIMQHVEQITEGRIRLGAGTLYGSLARMEKDNLISVVNEEERRKFYLATKLGSRLIKLEIERLKELYHNGLKLGGADYECK